MKLFIALFKNSTWKKLLIEPFTINSVALLANFYDWTDLLNVQLYELLIYNYNIALFCIGRIIFKKYEGSSKYA